MALRGEALLLGDLLEDGGHGGLRRGCGLVRGGYRLFGLLRCHGLVCRRIRRLLNRRGPLRNLVRWFLRRGLRCLGRGSWRFRLDCGSRRGCGYRYGRACRLHRRHLLLGLGHLARLGAHGLDRALLAPPRLAASLAALAGAALALGRARKQRVPVLAPAQRDVEASSLERRHVADAVQRREERRRVLVAQGLGREFLACKRLDGLGQKRLPAHADLLGQHLIEVEKVGFRERHGPLRDVPLCHVCLLARLARRGMCVLNSLG